MMYKQAIVCAVLLLAFMFTAPAPAQAAVVEITATVKSDFNKTTAAADSKLSADLNRNYSSLASLQEQDTDWEAKIGEIHKRNEEEMKLLRKQIQQIDAAAVGRLQTEVNAAKEKYKPLFEEYTALNKQIKAVKPLKNKDLNAMLQMQADVMKVAVSLAREEIRAKEASLKTVKDQKNRTMKTIRGTLAETEPVYVKIKAEKSAISTSKKSIDTEWKNFKLHIKNRDAKSASSSLTSLVSLSKKIVDKKQNIYSLEQKISEIIVKAKQQMPKYS